VARTNFWSQLKSGRVGTTLAAHRADETMLNVGQPDVIGPRVAADRDQV